MLDLSKMIKNNRLFKLLLENSFMTPEVISKMQHTDLHIIDLEDNSQNEDSDMVDSSRMEKILDNDKLSMK